MNTTSLYPSSLLERVIHLTKSYMLNEFEYTLSNYRMKYNSSFHENRSKPFTEEWLGYICSICDVTKKDSISRVLGRAHVTSLKKVSDLRRNGQFENY